jgi:hypothetical protein
MSIVGVDGFDLISQNNPMKSSVVIRERAI